jgi:ornithine decarboxylase
MKRFYTIMPEKLIELSKQYGTPCLFLSLAEVSQNFTDLTNALPNVTFFYAVKANPHAKIIEKLHSLGCQFDVSTNEEINIVKRNNVKVSDCIHTHPIKSQEEIRYSIEQDIKIFTVDNIFELEKLLPYKDNIEICIRLSILNEDCRINLSEKFGCSPDGAEELILNAHSQGFKVTTLSFHTGSQNLNPLKYVSALEQCAKIDNAVQKEGVQINCIDIGGGFPVQYCGDPIEIQTFCQPINEYLKENLQDKKIIAEPGRFLVASSMTLVTQIKGQSIREGKPWYFIDDSIYHSFSGIVFDYCDFPLTHFNPGPESTSIIAGSTCDSCDIIKRDVKLPEFKVGDYLIFSQMGAYCSASASHFNGYAPTSIYLSND